METLLVANVAQQFDCILEEKDGEREGLVVMATTCELMYVSGFVHVGT